MAPIFNFKQKGANFWNSNKKWRQIWNFEKWRGLWKFQQKWREIWLFCSKKWIQTPKLNNNNFFFFLIRCMSHRTASDVWFTNTSLQPKQSDFSIFHFFFKAGIQFFNERRPRHLFSSQKHNTRNYLPRFSHAKGQKGCAFSTCFQWKKRNETNFLCIFLIRALCC